MSNDKAAATFHGPNPDVAVHFEGFYVAVCHRCGWESPLHKNVKNADADADAHGCIIR